MDRETWSVYTTSQQYFLFKFLYYTHTRFFFFLDDIVFLYTYTYSWESSRDYVWSMASNAGICAARSYRKIALLVNNVADFVTAIS